MNIEYDWTCKDCGVTGRSEDGAMPDHICDTAQIEDFIVHLRRPGAEEQAEVVGTVLYSGGGMRKLDTSVVSTAAVLRALADEIDHRGVQSREAVPV